jgi:hypothetical protein
MTTKANFGPEEWELLVEAPPTAGMAVITADKGGMMRETFSMAKAYTEARKQHGQSELLDELVATKPKADRTRHGSQEELKEHALARLRDAVALLEAKATPEESDDYRGFVLALAERVASAHREGGVEISERERQVLDEIAGALGKA